MTNIRGIAKLAGVSAMTVSNVLNGRHDKVSPATVDRVLSIVEEVGYVRNAQARALSASQSGLIGMVYHGRSIGPLENPHDAALVSVVEQVMTRSGRHLLIRSADDVLRAGHSLRAWQIDGLVVLGTFAEEVDQFASELGIPTVFVDNYSPAAHVFKAGADDYQGGRLAAEHLIARGHRRLLFAGPSPHERGVMRERFDGFTAAVEQSGVNVTVDFAECLTDFTSGFRLGDRLVDAAHRRGRLREPLPDAIFAAADIVAIGLLNGLRRRGVQIPDDISLVGFDGILLGQLVDPPITTVVQDVAAKGRHAAEMLLALISSTGPAPTTRTAIPVTLEERDSVASRRWPESSDSTARSSPSPQ